MATGVPRGQQVRRSPLRASHGSSTAMPLHAKAEQHVRAATSGGEALSPQLRSFFEPRMQCDFSGVRIHRGPSAETSAHALGARAYAHGQNIVFGAGQFAPESADGRKLLAHELAHVAASGPVQRIARAVDKTKADPIKKELDSLVPFNSTLETLWNSFGTDLPEAINEGVPVTSTNGKSGKPESYRDLWWRSVTEDNISLSAAGGRLIAAFGGDTLSLAKSIMGSQLSRLEELQAELERARKQNATPAAPLQSSRGGVEDHQKALSRSTIPKRVANVGDLVDSATLVDFLENWESLLRTAPIGMRRVESSGLLKAPAIPAPDNSFQLLPGSPLPPVQEANAGPLTADLVPIFYNPLIPFATLLESPNSAFLDKGAFDALQKAFRNCSERRAAFRELAAGMLAEDANLAVLHERGMLSQVSALSGKPDSDANSQIGFAVASNLRAVRTFLGMLDNPGTVDWRDLGPIHGHLLAGGEGGRRNWGNLTSRGFIQAYFKDRAEAQQRAAKQKLAADIGIALVTLFAMLTPAAPLAAALLAVTEMYTAANVANSVLEAGRAGQRADVVSAAADAKILSQDEARQAREDAESKRVLAAVEVLVAVLPHLPAMGRAGARAVGAMGREITWARIGALGSTLNMAGLAAPGSDLILDLAKAGVSAVAFNRAGGRLVLSQMLTRIGRLRTAARAITLPMVEVTPALARAGDETLLTSGSKYGLSDYIRYHIHGPGTGFEGYPIMMAPTRANQFANNYIEEFMRNLQKSGATVRFSASYTTQGAAEMRQFVEGMLTSKNPAILNRLALDQGAIEPFLKNIVYDINVTRGGALTHYRASIAIGSPGSNSVVGVRPFIVP
ncbi:DUF4157 domain-containing protein [Massilia sp. BJB1822]|nr:DUF4157 domain-containing protein [Massilia sp. BJB1822]